MYPVLVTNPDFEVTTVEIFAVSVGVVPRFGAVTVKVAPETLQVNPLHEQDAPDIFSV